MTGPTARNRLADEMGPYLRQFVDDPINWQPWDEHAFTAAETHDVPIFLSIGHVTSPWCQRMRTESFHDEEVVDLINEHFVPIAVDRVRRPDLDLLYRTVCRVVEGNEGWPLSAWLTPSGEPFYVGTYFPPENEDWAPGFGDVLELIAEKWSSPEVREAVEDRGAEWTSYAREELEAIPERSDEADAGGGDTLDQIADVAVRTADRENGGWGTEGKFLEPTRIRLLLSADDESAGGERTDVAAEALDGVAAGGIRDPIGGGFFRSATNADWSGPRGGKHLDINAEVIRAFLTGYAATGNERYEAIARQAIAFLDRELNGRNGGFRLAIGGADWVAHDTDGGGGSETYYEWTAETVRSVLGDEADAVLACDRYGIGDEENAGPSVPNLAASIADLAEERNESETVLAERLDTITEKLASARFDRTRPPCDGRIVAGPNGLAIQALAEAGVVLDETYARRSEDALVAVHERFWDGDRLAGRYVETDGTLNGEPFLEDYAFLGRSAFACYGASGNRTALKLGLDIADTIVTDFFAESEGRIRVRHDRDRTLIVSPEESRDWDTPSPIAVVTELLSIADRFVPGAQFSSAATAISDSYGQRIPTDLLRHHSLALARNRMRSGWTEVTVTTDAVPGCWSSFAVEHRLNDYLFAPRPSTEQGLENWLDYLDVEGKPPVWTDREVSNEPTIHE